MKRITTVLVDMLHMIIYHCIHCITSGWKFLIYEMIVKPDLVANSYRQGYHDFKHLMYGDESSGPLSIDASTDRAGPIILCETPGIWGSLPGGFQHFWTEGVADVFVTFDVKDIKSFVFQPSKT